MPLQHIKELENIRKGIFLPPGIPDSKRIYFINGLFGVGKSRFVNELGEELLEKGVADAVCIFDGSDKLHFLPELGTMLERSFKANDNIKSILNSSQNDESECEYNLQRYAGILNIIHEKDKDLWGKLTEMSLLMSETDFILSDKKIENKIIEEEVLEQFCDKKGDRRLLMETPKVIAEAFIVDLMNKFYPSEGIGESFERHYSGIEPKKIVLIFDNFETVDCSLNRWLNECLLPYSCEKKFSEFISYQISYIDSKTQVSDFFDFRFVLSARENYLIKQHFDYKWEKYREYINEITIYPLTEEDLPDFFESYKVRIEQTSSEVIGLTHGIPLLLTSYMENYDSINSEDISTAINNSAVQSIEKFMTEEQLEWLRCASFLNEFDDNGLRCFPKVGADYKKAFLFLRNSTALSDDCSDNNGRIILNGLIKELMIRNTEATMPELVSEYKQRAAIYYDTQNVLSQLKGKEIDVARSFAYFNCFDEQFALENTFQTDIHLAKEFLANHPGWFIQNKATKSLKKEYAEKLMNYNKLVDGEKLSLKKEMVSKAWSDYSTEINNKIFEYDKELSSSSGSSAEIQEVIRTLKQEYEKSQTEFFELENELINMRRESTAFTKKSNISSGTICLLLSVSLGLLTNFFPDIFKSLQNDNKELYDIIYMISYTFAILFGILTIVYLIKEMTLRMRRNEYVQLKSDITQAEEENKLRQETMKVNKEKRTALENKEEENNLRKKILADEIESMKIKLSEPYI
jgi:hypothetical protein